MTAARAAMVKAMEAWSEFECPACGVDEDVEPPLTLGSEHRALCCGRAFVVSAENTQTCRRSADGELEFSAPE